MTTKHKSLSLLLLPGLLLSLGACGGLEQTGPGVGGKGDSFSDDGEIVFSCDELACEPQCQSTLEAYANSARTCARAALHQGPGCTIVCYDEQVAPTPSYNYGTVCETPRGECYTSPGPINGGCTCSDGTPGRITR